MVAIDFHSEIDITDKLKSATIDQLKNYIIIAHRTGIHWPSLDEDISLKGLLRSTIQKPLNNHQELALS